jgi:hypothetical protein
MTIGSSSMLNMTDRSNPCGPVMSTRTPTKRIGCDPALIGFRHVLAACFDGRFDPLTTGGRDSLTVEDGQWHKHIVPRAVGRLVSDIDT